MAKYGTVIVLSAPSGAGKHTILKRARAQDPKLAYSVSATTRAPRQGEVDGKDYYFLDRDTFEQRVANGEFAEWAEVHGNLYGTLRSELDRLVSSGKDVVLELDVQGMRSLKATGLNVVTIFIMPPSEAELARRLENRGANTPEDTALRLKNAREEMAARDEYDYVIVNDELNQAVEAFQNIVRQYRV